MWKTPTFTTYHSSSHSKAESRFCDNGHLVRLDLGNVFNTENACRNQEPLSTLAILAVFVVSFAFSQRGAGVVWSSLLLARLIKAQLCSGWTLLVPGRRQKPIWGSTFWIFQSGSDWTERRNVYLMFPVGLTLWTMNNSLLATGLKCSVTCDLSYLLITFPGVKHTSDFSPSLDWILFPLLFWWRDVWACLCYPMWEHEMWARWYLVRAFYTNANCVVGIYCTVGVDSLACVGVWKWHHFVSLVHESGLASPVNSMNYVWQEKVKAMFCIICRLFSKLTFGQPFAGFRRGLGLV